MELTVDQTLQQGVAAHNAGNLQEAERLYRVILQSQPKHPVANHHLGLIAVALGNGEAALPLFKTALETNPKIEQFWLNYIDALTKENKIKDAKRVIKKAKKAGFSGEKLKAAEVQLKRSAQARTKLPSVGLQAPAEEDINSMLESYQNGRYDDAERLAISITQQFPEHQFGWKILGGVFGQTGRISEAVNANKRVVQLAPQDAEAHSNLGNTLQELGRLEEAEASCRQAIALKSDYAEAHNNLGNTLRELRRLEEAEASCRQAIKLKSNLAEAHNNLGITLKELGRLKEAEVCCRQAMKLKSNFFQAHNNLGSTLKELGRLKEAEVCCRQAIKLKSDFLEAHSNLGLILYSNGDIDSALKSMEKANSIDPKLKPVRLLLSVLKSRKSHKKSYVGVDHISNLRGVMGLTSNPLILNRAVEAELISTLYEMNSTELDKTKSDDARYGNGRCSPDFNLFEDNHSIIKTVAEALIIIMMKAVKSEIFIDDSFFNILGAGGGLAPHRHLGPIDRDSSLNLDHQKFSLVYYLSVGDQNCSEPGILKLYDPSEDILPCEGMIMIFPSSRQHSAVYGGEKDRVMIGVNFYSLQ